MKYKVIKRIVLEGGSDPLASTQKSNNPNDRTGDPEKTGTDGFKCSPEHCSPLVPRQKVTEKKRINKGLGKSFMRHAESEIRGGSVCFNAEKFTDTMI